MRTFVTILLSVVATLSFSCSRVRLETRTYDLHYLDPGTASALIEPYIYRDRDGAPGSASAIDRAITVRETPDNLDRIGRVLEEYDAPPPSMALHFQLIEADGNRETDPRIANVEEELRKLFRFDGYRLLTETVATTLAGHAFSQTMFEEKLQNGGMAGYSLEGRVGPLRGSGDSARVEIEVNLQGLLGASVSVPLGHTVVLGTTRLPSRRAIILTVRAERASGS